MTQSQTRTQTCILSNDTLIKLPTHKFYRQTFLFEELLSILLWAVTRISYDVKCLIDGSRGMAIQPSGGWDRGTIRLLTIATLQMRGEERVQQIDCLTKQIPTYLLPDSAVIQTDTNLICREPRQVNGILKELKEEVQIACAEMTDFVKPTRLGYPTIEFLEPGKEWRQAQMRLDMDMSFVSDRAYDENGQPRDAAIARDMTPLGEMYISPLQSLPPQ
jgi:hypothetical protein